MVEGHKRTGTAPAGMLRYELQAMVRHALEELHHAVDAGDADLERVARADLDRARDFAIRNGLNGPEGRAPLAPVVALRRPAHARPDGATQRVG